MVEEPAEQVLTGGNVAGGCGQGGADGTQAGDQGDRYLLEYIPGEMADTLPPMTAAGNRRRRQWLAALLS